MTTQLEVSNILTPLINGFKIASDEWKNFFEIGLSDYLQSQTEKYYFTNTFIHRSEKVRFNDIYYPIKAEYKKLVTSFDNIEQVFEEYKKITIIGSAGSGKTTLIKHIFLRTIQENKRIPILIELRFLNEYKGDFEKMITDKIINTKLKPNNKILSRALKTGKFLFLLDGYDEIFSSKKQEINQQIESFIDSYPNNFYVITTRPGSGIEAFPRFHDFRVKHLNNDDVLKFIEKIVEESERKKRITDIVLDKKNQNYLEFLRNPLLLSMFIMAFENHPEIPKRKSAFYRNVFDTLYSRHDGITKNSFPREKLTKLQREDFEEILCIFSYISMIEGKYSFTNESLTDVLNRVKESTDYTYDTENLIYDLRTAISILILDGFEYYFPHRSIQEYFTAQFIQKLPTQRKNRAYKNLQSILLESSTDNSFNFWSLCFELDENSFIKNFLIPNLKKIYKQIEGKEGKNLIKSFFNIFDPVMLMGMYGNKNNKKVLELRIYRRSSFKDLFLDFCEVYDYDELWVFPKKTSAYDKLVEEFKRKTDYEDKENKKNSLNISNDNEMIELLLEADVTELLKKYRDSIFQKLTIWEEKLNRKIMNMDNLLK